MRVAPNNYPFYSDSAKYTPLVQSDGGQLSGEESQPGNDSHIRTQQEQSAVGHKDVAN